MFHDARLKIDRANKHIADLDPLIVEIQQRHVSLIKKHEAGGDSIHYTCSKVEPLLHQAALISGDAIHNLHSSLDFAWFGTIQALGLNMTNRTKFPFYSTREELNRLLTERQINTASPELFKWITSDVKPYPGGNDFLYALHKADIADKHKLLNPIVQYIGAKDICIEDPDGVEIPAFTHTWDGNDPVHIDLPPGYKIKNKGKISASVVFDKGLSLTSLDVRKILRHLSGMTLEVVEGMERIVF